MHQTANRGMEIKNYTTPAYPSITAALFPLWWLCTVLYRSIKTRFFVRDSNEPTVRIIHKGIHFGEGPRFHNGSLYFADMFGRTVVEFDVEKQKVVKEIDFPSLVSAIGWLPDGRMLVVSMNELKVLCHDERTGRTEDYADLSEFSRFRCNEMCVDALGRAYVGNFGFDLGDKLNMRKTTLIMVDENRIVHKAASDMFFPNGTVITPDGKTLIVAESIATHLSAFDINSDGTLKNRRVWADLGVPPDGICIDAEGCVWVAVPQIGLYHVRGGVLRVKEGGEILQMIGFGGNGLDRGVVACMLATNSQGQHQLLLLTAQSVEDTNVIKLGSKNSQLGVIDVDVGPAIMEGNSLYCSGYC